MATESATPLLRKIRSHLQEMAGSNLSTRTTTIPLPSLDEIVTNSGSGPFRCQKCKASLLLGPNSQICAACGTRREEVASSFHISFASTLACQCLLASFQPEGSVATGKSTHIEAASLQIQQTEPKDGLIACDILSLELKWPDDETRSKQHLSVTQITNANTTHGVAVDLEDFFCLSKSQKADLPKEALASTHQIQNVKLHAPADPMPQVSVNEMHVEIFSAQSRRQETQTYSGDDDPFGDFRSANSIDNSESKNLDTFATPDDSHLHLPEERKGLDWDVVSHSNFHGQDLFADSVNGAERAMPLQGICIQDDPWSAVIKSEPYRSSSKIHEENTGSWSDWTEDFNVKDSQDSFSGSAWQQDDILQHNDSTTEKSRNHTAGENGGEELNGLFTSHLSTQALKLDRESPSANTAVTDVDLFNRIESREANAQARPNSVPLEMNYLMADMPKASSYDDSKHVVESLLCEMHDLSFMLADHLVIPDRDREHALRI